MPASFEVDQFTSVESRRQLFARHDQAIQTLGAVGLLNAEIADGLPMLFGGGALAVQGIDAYLPHRRGFDLDIAVPSETFTRLNVECGGFQGLPIKFGSGLQGRIKQNAERPLPIDLVTTDDPTDITRRFTHGQPLEKVAYTIDGANVLGASTIAAHRSVSGKSRVKDLAGLIKGHVVATAMEHPITEIGLWNISIGAIADRIMSNDLDAREIPAWRRITKKGPNYPSWLQQLVERDFEHPAFANIPRLSKES